MTRFARAKGSKSSNERVPDESTPWHVMKQQLESALEREEKPQVKTKSAKQLINERDDLYYAKSLGNISCDWAEFESSGNKGVSKKDSKVAKTVKNQNKTLKKALKNSIAEESTVSNNVAKEEIGSKTVENTSNLKEKKRKQKDSTPVDSGTSEIKSKKQKRKIDSEFKPETDDIQSNSSVKIQKEETNTTEKAKNNKRKSKVKDVSGETAEEHSDPTSKLSKRQKRNQKKQNKKNEDESEAANTATFNAEGNDWNNSVNFSKRRKCMDNDPSNNVRGNKFNPNDKLFNRFGNNVPRRFQVKTAKPRDDREHKRRKPDNDSIKVTINGMDVEIVKYDGFPIKKEDAERLKELRKTMVLKGIPKSEIDAAMKLERRKCEKALARIRKQVCFHCRKAGHNLSDCPELGKEEAGTGICFKCGSTEHTHFECKVNKSDDYRYAKCFICREQGHIAKQCPDNPKGLYPDGGSCKICGDVTHLKKDCPDVGREKEEATITLDTIKETNLEALGNESTVAKSKVSSKKIVKF